MNRTLRFSKTCSRRSSLSENGSGAATDQAPLQTFQRGLLQQYQGVTNIVGVGLGMGGQDLADTQGQPPCPAPGFGGIGDWSALFHADEQSLTSVLQLVTDVVMAERKAWLEAVTNDPLLPGRILPSDYLGQQARRF
jgi:hypothetical protein